MGPHELRTAYLVLGRDCVNAGFEPPEAQQCIAEIRLLRR
jgi:hypothetical protein